MKKNNTKKTSKSATKKTVAKKPVTKRSRSVAELKQNLAEIQAKQAAEAKAKKPTEPKAKKANHVPVVLEVRPTKTSVAESMILAGKTNSEVLDALIALFPNFDVGRHKYYPGWFRARLVRQGKLTKKQADATRH